MEDLRVGEASSGAIARRNKQLMLLIVIQAAFLASTYAVGVWLTTEVHDASITLPEVIAHGVTSAGFGILTGTVGFLAAIQKKRSVGIANGLLFALTVAAGATGFSFLGNTSDPTGISITNLSMMTAVGLGMPVTGYSLSVLSRDVRGEEHGASSAPVMIYLALASLAFTIIAGAAVPSISLYATAVAAHVGLAALTVSLVLGVLIVTVLESAETVRGRPGWLPQRVGYALVSLAAISLAAGDGVIGVTGGGLSYIVVMGEVGALVYAFLLVAVAAPYHPVLRLIKPFGWFRRMRSIAGDQNK
ncbi:MAG TPA: hypothetical protein VFV92_15335 [Candidatus Bathyarchaeia archaeon]|nr:hypothetical protein [Candidatus Bathyarchaeia archaeon]